MTEAEWLACGDPHRMLEFLGGRASVRKLRLLACACCRRLWPHLSAAARRSVRAAERFADGLATPEELAAARGPNYSGIRADNSGSFAADPSRRFRRSVRFALFHAAWSAGWPGWVERIIPENEAAEKAAQAAVVREVFGNPFRRVARKRAWLTSDVLALARGVYDERAFDRLPILADALQDAGCDGEDVLNHLRDEATPHVHGCWVLDLVLGKE
jgi:hypothetical protein